MNKELSIQKKQKNKNKNQPPSLSYKQKGLTINLTHRTHFTTSQATVSQLTTQYDYAIMFAVEVQRISCREVSQRIKFLAHIFAKFQNWRSGRFVTPWEW